MKGCEPFSLEDEAKLMRYFSKRRHAKRNIALLTLGMQTGFRISELLSIRRRDIVKAGKIVDRVYMAKSHMKGGKGEKHRGTSGRAMLLTDKTKKALNAQLNELNKMGYTEDHNFVFQNQFRQDYPISRNGVWRLLNKAARDIGLTGKVGTHSMRKTFAGRIYDELLTLKNCDALRTLAKGLGHENINNTDKYLSFRETELVGAIQRVFGDKPKEPEE